MIDINELRQLAQVATPGPWQFWHGWVATNIDSDGGTVIAERPTPSGGKYQARVDGNFRFIAAANPAVINELLDRLESAESDELEQARLNGMGASREAALMAKLEAAEKEIALKERVIDALGSELNAVANERDALQAKIAEMEKQEPAAFALYSGWAFKAAYHKEHEACDQRDRRQLSADLGGSLEAYRVVPLYALPGAKGEEK